MKKKLLSYLVVAALIVSLVAPSGIFNISALADEMVIETEENVETEDVVTEEGNQNDATQVEDEVESTDEQVDEEVVPDKEKRNEGEKKAVKQAKSASVSAKKKVSKEIPAEDVAVIMTQNGIKTEYNSINDAIAAAKANGTDRAELVLQKDVTEDIVIENGTRITLYLNGHTVTNKSGHTIHNKSKLTYIYGGATKNDTSKVGTVDNVSHGKAAIYNDINASMYVYGGNFTRSAEASTGDTASGGNSYYVIKNYGYLEINDGVNVKFSDNNLGLYSSLIGSGWQDAVAAEAGKNGEPKPSNGGNKATLTISGGTFTGGQITIKNDDYGVLNVKGGTIIQPSDNRAAIANNNAATISGGTIEAKGANGQAIYSRYFDTNGANKGELTISGGTLKSTGNVVQAQSGSSLEITGGIFETNDKTAFIIDLQGTVTAMINSGKYIGTSIEKIVNKDDVFAEEFAPKVDTDGSIIIDIEDKLANVIVIDNAGNVKNYKDLGTALAAAKAGSTVKLQKDVVLQRPAKTAKGQADITLDLNGFNIDGTATAGYTDGVISMKPGYGWKPIEGMPNKMSIINSKPGTGGEIKGEKPFTISSGDSTYKIAGEVGEGVKLVTLDPKANAVELGTGAYLIYGIGTKDLIKNGGFKITDANSVECIYGNYANAAPNAHDGVVTLLHNYNGDVKIKSGSKDATLDLGGHTYTYTSEGSVIDVNHPNVTLTVKNGKVVATDKNCDGAHLVGAGAGETQMNNRGLVLDNVELTVPGEVYGIVTNGTETGNKITLKDSVLNVPEGAAIYFPSTGEVIIDNSVINAKLSGIQMCAGSLTVKGEKSAITVTGQPQEKTEGDGVISDGSAISIVERAGYKDFGNIVIEEGTFTSADGVAAVSAYVFANGTSSDWAEAKDYVDVVGGLYSSQINKEIIAEDSTFVKYESDGKETFAVGKKSIDSLVAKAKAGDKITVIKGDIDFDINIDGVIVANDGDGNVTVNGNKVTDKPVETTHTHKTEVQNAKEATCTEEGYTGDEVCTVCHEIIAKGKVIPTKDHQYDDRGKCTVCGVLTDDAEAANKVDALIDAIGSIDKITLDSKDSIMAAKAAYEALTEEQKDLVTGLDDLNAAIAAYNKLLEDEDGSKDPSDKPSDEEITKPVAPKEDVDGDKDDSDSVKTGDDTTVGLLAGMLLLSGAGFVALRRKEK